VQGGSEAGSGMVQTESDCSSLICMLKKRERIRSQLGFLVEEVLEWGDKLPEWKIIHTKRAERRST